MHDAAFLFSKEELFPHYFPHILINSHPGFFPSHQNVVMVEGTTSATTHQPPPHCILAPSLSDFHVNLREFLIPD